MFLLLRYRVLGAINLKTQFVLLHVNGEQCLEKVEEILVVFHLYFSYFE